jgi:hypothetical protein
MLDKATLALESLDPKPPKVAFGCWIAWQSRDPLSLVYRSLTGEDLVGSGSRMRDQLAQTLDITPELVAQVASRYDRKAMDAFTLSQSHPHLQGELPYEEGIALFLTAVEEEMQLANEPDEVFTHA